MYFCLHYGTLILRVHALVLRGHEVAKQIIRRLIICFCFHISCMYPLLILTWYLSKRCIFQLPFQMGLPAEFKRAYLGFSSTNMYCIRLNSLFLWQCTEYWHARWPVSMSALNLWVLWTLWSAVRERGVRGDGESGKSAQLNSIKLEKRKDLDVSQH